MLRPGSPNRRKTDRPSTGSVSPSRGREKEIVNEAKALEKLILKILKSMEPNPPFLKGKLTAISLAMFTLIQTPNLLSDLSKTADTFADASAQPISVLSFVAALGIIWGGVRRAANYFGR